MINNHLHSRAEVKNERSCISPPPTYLHSPDRDAFTAAVLSGKQGYCVRCDVTHLPGEEHRLSE